MHENPAPAEPPPSDTPPPVAAAPRDEAAIVDLSPAAAPPEAAPPAPAPLAEPPSQLNDTLVGFRVPDFGPVPVITMGPDTPAAPLPVMSAPLAPAPAPAPEPPHEPASVTFLVVVTALSLAADLVTKGWAKAALSSFDTKIHGQKRFEVWKHHLDFIFAQNPGGAWSFLRSLPDTLRRPFFLVVSAAAIVFIVSIYQRVHKDQTAMKWGLPLALGGAMGNLVDRIRYGWVIDFIDFSVRWGGRDHHWPTFNVADIAIVAGVLLMGLDMGRSRRLPMGMHEHEAPKLGSAPLPPAA